MKGSRKPGILKYLRSLIPSRLFPKNKFYWLLLCSSIPMLIGTSGTLPVAAEEQIVQVVSGGSVSRPTLRVGSQGDAVSELQAALKLLGYYNGVVDGNYTEQTATAVSRFQKEAGLPSDGVAGSTTWQKLFPGSPVASSSGSSPRPISTRPITTANDFPVPTQSGSMPTAISSGEPRPISRAITASNPEPRQISRATTASNPEPRPSSRTTSNTSSSTSRSSSRVNSVTSNSEPRPTTPNRSRNIQSTTQSTTRSQQGGRSTQTMRQSTRVTSSGTRSNQTSRSSQTTQQSPRTRQSPSIQYTSEGMPILRLGMQGEEVAQVQRRLIRLGFFKGPADGDFGAATETAVKALQERYGIEPDGVVGGGTWPFLMPRRQQQRSSI